MPRKNIFSGKYEPDRDTCTEANESNVARFRTAMLKLDRIHNDDNEKDLTENIMQLCSRNNKTWEKIELSAGYEFEDAMDWLEKVYNDVDADLMIMAIDQLAERYGYTPDMDETIEIVLEDKWRCWESFADITNDIQTIYNSLPTSKRKEDFKTSIAAGLRLYKMESQSRQRVHRGEIWRVEVPTGVGSETTGMRWALVISQKAHTKGSYTFNAVYLDGQAVKKEAWQMEITEADLQYGVLLKETDDNKCRINLTDIFTLDRKRLMDRKGKVSDAFMKKVMTRIAAQLGITLDSGSIIEGI